MARIFLLNTHQFPHIISMEVITLMRFSVEQKSLLGEGSNYNQNSRVKGCTTCSDRVAEEWR
jgi:hypothetical protein